MENNITGSLLEQSVTILEELKQNELNATIQYRVDQHIRNEETFRKYNLIQLKPLEIFLDSCISKHSDRPQKYKKRDPQYDILCTEIINFTTQHTLIIDFSCGPYLNLMQQIDDYQIDNNTSSLITYLSIDEFETLRIEEIPIETLIIKYYNNLKEINNIFFNDYSKLFNFVKTYFDNLANYVIVKNVGHEVKLKDLSKFIDHVYNITALGGKILFYDLSDISEPYNLPWDYEIYDVIFKSFLNCDINHTKYDATEKRKALHMCLITKKSEIAIDPLKLKKRLIDYYNSRSMKLISEKIVLINGDRKYKKLNDEEKRMLYLKIINYHSNIEQQIREAKEKWNL